MRITEKKLRRIIRNVIKEDLDMRDRLSPSSYNSLGDDMFNSREFDGNIPYQDQQEAKRIIAMKNTDPAGYDRAVANFPASDFFDICELLGIDA
jgi:hypothetical protein